eukprot:TRINITY_DN5753_c0_g1_i1.p1 TRINITY_DN5753_c0_g1~~TRINITY_DN5753_c0_g1_i1.p1  ORF type:complete len:611 (+),score=145.30 TRINITY_DN5753_c0_g1_i1:192-2024(+)
MQYRAFLLLSLAFAFCAIASAVSGTLGIGISLSANTATQIDFLTGEQLTIEVNTASTLTVSSETTLTTSLPPGYVGLATGIAYRLTFSNSPTVTSATFTTNAISATVLTAAGVSVPGVLQYDASQSFYSHLPSTVTASKVSFAVPAAGLFVVAGVQAGAAVPTAFSTTTTVANNGADYKFSYPQGFMLGVRNTGAASGSLSVTFSATSAVTTPPSGYFAVGSYFSVTFTGTASYNATIFYAYSTTVLATLGISASSLRLYRNNAGTWTAVSGNSIDAAAGLVLQATTTFSEWGVFGQSSGAASASGSLGTAVTVSANTATLVNFTSGEQFSLTASSAGTVTVSTYASATAGVALPTGYLALNVATGFQFATSTSGFVSASFTTTSISAIVAATIGIQAPGVLMFDSTQQAYMYIPSTYTAGKLTFNVPQAAIFLIVGVQVNAVLPVIFSSGATVNNDNTQRTYSFPNGFTLQLQTRGSGSSQLVVTRRTADPYPNRTPSNYRVALGTWYNVSLSGASSLDATLQQTYTNAMVTSVGVNATTLRWGVYNAASGLYSFPSSGGSVDTSAMVVSQTTTSFSEWGVYGAAGFAVPAVAVWVTVTVVACALASLL